MNATFVGVDVSKNWLDVHALETGAAPPLVLRVPNSPEGCEAIVAALRERSVDRIVVESTGGYERLLVAVTSAARLPIVVVNARQARDLAKACGKLAKTDRIDALGLARFAQAIRPELRPIPDETERKLKETLARRGQLMEMRTMEKNRLLQMQAPAVRASIKAVIAARRRTAKGRQRPRRRYPVLPGLAGEGRPAQVRPRRRRPDRPHSRRRTA